MRNDDSNSVPSWLEIPPDSVIKPPSITRKQELPFADLSWENFERLCLRLVRLEADVEHSQFYGVRGQKQHGIDLYARSRSTIRYSVYQCKHEEHFSAAKIRSAVERFRTGKWFGKADTLVLCSTEDFSEAKRADEVEAQVVSLRNSNVKFISWDASQLSLKLKEHPSLVDDFFGRQWVRRFCGDDAADELGSRLDSAEVLEFRHRLGTFYKHVFNTHDPGLPALATTQNENPLPLEERFVLPFIDDVRVLNRGQQSRESDIQDEHGYSNLNLDPIRERRKLQARRLVSYLHRRPIDAWLAGSPRNVILGGPGSGKSSLLRFTILDLLSDVPQLIQLAEKWGSHLPIWVPFAFWTKKISESTTSDVSLNEAIHGWLKSWDEERLWPLVEQSLNDERLLLLVDGLDEHTNEEAAAIALSRLQVFIKQRNLPAIVTSRPLSFEKLGMQTAEWSIGPLSDFSITQQEQLIRLWFSRWIKNTNSDQSKTEDELKRSLNKEIEAFKTDLQGSGDLRELAKVPLLLSLLIAHKVHHVQLPQSRFKAYESLIDYLLITHPKRRRLAAAVSTDPINLNDGDMKTVIAHLAFCIQKEFIEGTIDYKAARKRISNFLMDPENGLGLPLVDARNLSQQILDIGENNLGLLVKKSQTELGFFHLVFQEYLAALHIATLGLTEQMSMIEARCADPQWREVILSLLHITTRREDIRSFVELIRKPKDTHVDRHAIDLILGEIAFGDFGCTTDLVHELAKDTFTRIEVGSWLPQRERLLNHALDGLQSLRVRDLVKAKLRAWFPDKTRWKRGDVFREMGRWSPDDRIVECLWRGLYDEYVANMLLAAEALANLKRGDSQIGKRLAMLAWNEPDPRVRSVALRALQKGWPYQERLPEILRLARRSEHPELQLASISAHIERGETTNTDLKRLLYIGSSESGLDYSLQPEVASTLTRGWSNSATLKSECLRAVKSGRSNSILERDIAEAVLLTGFHQDDDAASYFAEELERETFTPRFSFALPDRSFFTYMAESFRNHSIVGPAVEGYIHRNQTTDFLSVYLFDAALVNPTPTAKKFLLSRLDEYPHLIAPILLKVWGAEDEAVIHALRSFATSAGPRACRIGREISQITPEKDLAYEQLLGLLRAPDRENCSAVIDGIASLGIAERDSEVLDTIFSLPDNDATYAAASLITSYPKDPRVRELAEKQFESSFGCLDVIAASYSEDRSFRERLIEAVTPLSTPLRTIIATKLGQMPGIEDLATLVLRGYETEFDKEVQVQASVSYHSLVWSTGSSKQADIDRLRDGMAKRWLDLGGTAEANFCGLAILNRLDIFRDLRITELKGEKSRVSVPISELAGSPSVAFLRTLLENWDQAHKILENEFWDRFTTHEGKYGAWDQLCVFADEYTAPQREALAFWESQQLEPDRISLNMLGFIDRAAPKTRLLRDYCLSGLATTKSNPYYTSEVAEYAIQLLAKHFAGEESVLKELMTLTPAKTSIGTEVIPENVILALCEGWPETDEFEQMLESVSSTSQPLRYASYFQLSSRVSESKNLFRELISYLSKAKRRRSELWHSNRVSRPLIRRLTKDDDLLDICKAHLQKKPTASEKISLSRLIALARGTVEIRNWCLEEIDRQLDEQTSPEVGVDILQGRLRSVAHALLDVMAQTGR